MVKAPRDLPTVLPMRERARVVYGLVQERLTDLLPRVMREVGIDMWVILCQEDDLMAEFRQGLTGNELLHAILSRAREVGVSGPKVYSHNLGLFLHEPGPLIGLPWEQERCAGRGDVALEPNQTFTMELSVTDVVPEWDGQAVTFSMEEDVAFTDDGCFPVDGRQTEFYLL